jgi:hypothetical protein
MSMNLIVFKRQHLAIDVVYDESVDIQSLKMCWLGCAAAVCGADRRIEPQIKRGKKPEKRESVALGTK